MGLTVVQREEAVADGALLARHLRELTWGVTEEQVQPPRLLVHQLLMAAAVAVVVDSATHPVLVVLVVVELVQVVLVLLRLAPLTQAAAVAVED